MLKNAIKTKNVLSTSLIVIIFILGLILLMEVIMGIPYIFNNIKDTNTIVHGI